MVGPDGARVSAFVEALKGKLYTGPVRRALRRLGVGRLLSVGRFVRSLGYRARWGRSSSDEVTINISGLSARFRVSSPFEREQVVSLGHEGRLLRRVLREVPEGGVVYDVGTNLGLYTVLFALAVGPKGSVIGFEPEVKTCDRVLENLRLNALRHAVVFDVALGNREQDVNLFVDDRLGSGVHNLLNNTTNLVRVRLQPTRMVIGDRFISEKGLPSPNLIKIDVEGLEEEVVLGLAETLRRPECRAVFCEMHLSILERTGHPDAPRSIERILRDSGFRRMRWLNYSHMLATKGS